MKRKQVMGREALAKKLEEWASRIRAGEPIVAAGERVVAVARR